MPTLSEVASKKLQSLDAQGRKRTLVVSERQRDAGIIRDNRTLISFSCNDYLGLSQYPEVIRASQAALARYGHGAGASRLVTGNHPLYGELETQLAGYKGFEKALVFGSGYLANLGIIPTIMGKGDLIIADKLVHACLIDGAQLSGAKLLRFEHNNVADCERILTMYRKEYCHCLIVTDEVFSMDGDIAPLEPLSILAKHHDAWLMADGAHSLHSYASPVDIYMGTLSKTLGAYGGYVCAKAEVIEYLVSSARSFTFTTALPSSVIAGALQALKIIEAHPELITKTLQNAELFCEYMELPTPQSPIVPIILGEEEKALNASNKLKEQGFIVSAIRPPTVPLGTSRLRVTFSAMHDEDSILRLAKCVKRIL